MAVYKVLFAQRNDNFVVIQTLTEPLIELGQVFVPSGFAPQYLSTNYTILAKPQYLFLGVDSSGNFLYDTQTPLQNQLLYNTFIDGADYPRARLLDSPITISVSETCTWVNGTAVGTWLGIALAGVDETAFLTQCASSASDFIFRRRQESGYTDSLTTSPGSDVTLATTMYAGALYRQRGAVNDFAGFTEMGTPVSTGLSPLIKQLAGIPRPAVA